MRVLLTGAAGFLGSHVIKALLERGDQVVAMDVVAARSAPRLKPFLSNHSFEYKWQSVVDLKAEDLMEVDYVLHFAALTDVPLANTSPRYTFQLNVDAALSLFAAAKGAGGSTPVFAMSTENVYGSIPPERLPAVEDEPPRARNIYAASKVAVEAIARSYSFQYGLPVSFIRSSTLFGPEMRTGQVVAIFARQAIEGSPITIEGDGSQTRDFNYVDNMVQAILKIIDVNPSGFNVWNIGSGVEMSLKQLVEMILDVSHSSSEIQNKPWRPGEEGRLAISIEKARKELGYEPKVSVEEGIRRLIAWMRVGLA